MNTEFNHQYYYSGLQPIKRVIWESAYELIYCQQEQHIVKLSGE